jgi:hypothetical protein
LPVGQLGNVATAVAVSTDHGFRNSHLMEMVVIKKKNPKFGPWVGVGALAALLFEQA